MPFAPSADGQWELYYETNDDAEDEEFVDGRIMGNSTIAAEVVPSHPEHEQEDTAIRPVLLLLLAGQATDHRGWPLQSRRKLLSAMGGGGGGGGAQTVVFDYRGTGQSRPSSSSCGSESGLGKAFLSTRLCASDAMAVVDHLLKNQHQSPQPLVSATAVAAAVHVFGVSFGGRVAQWVALDFPTRVCSLILGGTTPGNAHGIRRPPQVDTLLCPTAPAIPPSDPHCCPLEDANVAETIRKIEAEIAFDRQQQNKSDAGPNDRDNHNEEDQLFLRTLVSSAWMRTAESRTRIDEVMHVWDTSPLNAEWRRAHFLASEAHDTFALLPQIGNTKHSIPTLVLHGSDDVVNPTANASLLVSRIGPSVAELHIVPHGRHCFYIEFEDLTVELVANFIRKHHL